jgi:hypothetical protein
MNDDQVKRVLESLQEFDAAIAAEIAKHVRDHPELSYRSGEGPKGCLAGAGGRVPDQGERVPELLASSANHLTHIQEKTAKSMEPVEAFSVEQANIGYFTAISRSIPSDT